MSGNFIPFGCFFTVLLLFSCGKSTPNAYVFLPLNVLHESLTRSYQQETATTDEIESVHDILDRHLELYNAKMMVLYKHKNEDLPYCDVDKRFYVVDLDQYKRQYISVVNANGEKEIWINAFTGNYPTDWEDKILIQNDGSRLFFCAVVNVDKMQLNHFSINDQEFFYPKEWELIWSDDFSDSKLNEADWKIVEPEKNYNNEKQAYTRKNVMLAEENGNHHLKLIGKNEIWKGEIDEETVIRDFTSGQIVSKKSWQYGRFEIRAKVAKSKGFQSEIWMAPVEGWPPQIDIMKLVGKDVMRANFALYYGSENDVKSLFGGHQEDDYADRYHVYAIEWDSDNLKWFVDGLEYFQTQQGIPQEEMRLKLSLAIGSDWSGNPDTTSLFPQSLDIDWVKVYRKPEYKRPPQWSLVWEETFDHQSLNNKEWHIMERGENFNNEKQAYVKDNVSIHAQNDESYLVLTGKKESWSGPSNLFHDRQVSREFTSGEVASTRSWTYGKFEVRAKPANTKGFLSAIWMTPRKEIWPPEIDIAEVLGDRVDTVFLTNHFGTQDSPLKDGGFQRQPIDFTKDFHLYTVEWEPSQVRWYVDGVKCHESFRVPHEPMYLRLSLSIGSDWAGDPTEDSKFPQDFKIDWVKVYQREFQQK